MSTRPLIILGLFSLTCVAFACSDDPPADNLNASSSSGGGSSSSSSSSGGGSSSSSSGAVSDASADATASDARPDAGPSMSFFVTSTGSGNMGGNLGGLAGADMKCQTLAAAAGAGGRTWRAYLSVQGTDARTRIGTGPWYNQKLKLIAADLNALHTNEIPGADVVDEKGVAPPANQHDILTGTAADGTSNGANCAGWTSNAANGVMRAVGHSDNNRPRWNFSHNSDGCSERQITGTGGNGRIYCFAL